MKVGIYDPYLKTMGGGERYALTFAEVMIREGHKVDIFWNENMIDEAGRRFGLDLKGVNFETNIFVKHHSLIKRLSKLRLYDLFFCMSDGSIPWVFGKKNILHFQVPFKDVVGRSVLNKLKLSRFDYVVCNSFFTKKFIDREYGIESIVIYPPVEVGLIKTGKKEKVILSLGRFSASLHAKQQGVLIGVFKDMVDEGLKNWQLILAGGALGGVDDEFVQKLRIQAQGYPIDFKINISFEEIKKLYAKTKIYWHAAGFGIEEKQTPEKAEHFGISIVEAMAAGCVSVVVGKGGPKEILKHGESGFFWKEKDQLKRYTFCLIKSEVLRKKISAQSVERSRSFSKERFRTAFLRIV